jgi:hypothetical protein
MKAFLSIRLTHEIARSRCFGCLLWFLFFKGEVAEDR